MVTSFRLDRLLGLLFPLGVMAVATLPAHVLAGDEVPYTLRGGGVAVRATRLPAEGEILRFRIEMDTHARDLDGYRFEQIVRLRDATGKEIPPLAVEQMMGGGHHRAAVLRFPAPNQDMTAVEVVVRDVAGIPERLFRWDLRGSAPSNSGPPGEKLRMQ